MNQAKTEDPKYCHFKTKYPDGSFSDCVNLKPCLLHSCEHQDNNSGRCKNCNACLMGHENCCRVTMDDVLRTEHEFTELNKEPEDWEVKFEQVFDRTLLSPIRNKVKSFIYNLLKADHQRIREGIDNLKRKCDGEFGCGWDGTQENRQYLCGGPMFAHEHIKCVNEVLEKIEKIID